MKIYNAVREAYKRHSHTTLIKSILRENVRIGQSNAKLKIFVLNVRHICAMPKTAKKT